MNCAFLGHTPSVGITFADHAKLPEHYKHLMNAIRSLEEHSAFAHEEGHHEAVQVLIATAGMLRAFAFRSA